MNKIKFYQNLGNKAHILKEYLCNCPFWMFWILITVIYASIFTAIDFSDNTFSGLTGFFTIFSYACIVSISCAGLWCLISLNKVIFAIFYPLIITCSWILSYYHLNIGVSLTSAYIEIMLENDMTVWSSLIETPMVATSLCAFVLSIAVVVYRWKCVRGAKHISRYLVVGLLLLFLPLNYSRTARAVSNRMPFVFYNSIAEYLTNKKEIAEKRSAFAGIDLEQGETHPDIVLIIGEALRPDHLGINGYCRQTTPRLAADTAIVSFPNVETRKYHTQVSVPHILTRADSISPDLGYEEESFITLFKRMGYNSYWLSNQDMMTGYTYFMHETDSMLLLNPARTLHNFVESHDMDLLRHLDRYISDNNRNQPQLLILHTMGSHWVYTNNYADSFAIYQPEIDSIILSELSAEQLTNSYDNTIVATDAFVSEVINRYRDKNAFVIFISDHGECLGENGKYLHGFDAPEVRTTACFFWYSNQYAKLFPEKIDNLRRNAGKPWLTDMIFHTVLDAADFKISLLDYSQSALSSSQND